MLVALVRGAMGPMLERTIKERLSHEHKVLQGEAERVEVSMFLIFFRYLPFFPNLL